MRIISKSFASKEKEVAQIKELLQDARLMVVIDYQGLTVAQMTDLRSRLREGGGNCKITKNSLMGKAVEENEDWKSVDTLLKGSSAFILADEESIGSTVRAYNGFLKEIKKTELRGGVMEGKALCAAEVKALADLPTKEELFAKIAGSINAVTTKVARSINEVPSSLARAINAVKSKQEDEAA